MSTEEEENNNHDPSQRRQSTASSDTSSEGTTLSGETLYSPTSPQTETDSLPKVHPILTDLLSLPLSTMNTPRLDPPQTEQEQRVLQAAAQAGVQVEVKAPLKENNPLSYVDALRLRLPREGDASEMKSRGLWDYWRGGEGVS